MSSKRPNQPTPEEDAATIWPLGKHRNQPLGMIPQQYLKWAYRTIKPPDISAELRAAVGRVIRWRIKRGIEGQCGDGSAGPESRFCVVHLPHPECGGAGKIGRPEQAKENLAHLRKDFAVTISEADRMGILPEPFKTRLANIVAALDRMANMLLSRQADDEPSHGALTLCTSCNTCSPAGPIPPATEPANRRRFDYDAILAASGHPN